MSLFGPDPRTIGATFLGPTQTAECPGFLAGSGSEKVSLPLLQQQQSVIYCRLTPLMSPLGSAKGRQIAPLPTPTAMDVCCSTPVCLIWQLGPAMSA